jgi:hypothetical protein
MLLKRKKTTVLRSINVQVVCYCTFELGKAFLALSSFSWCICDWLKRETVDCIKGNMGILATVIAFAELASCFSLFS